MLSYRTLSIDDYTALRYQVLVNVEETGDPKEEAYLDSKKIPTIGIGFNLRTEIVRDEVLRKFGFDIFAAPGTVEKQYLDEIRTIVNASYTEENLRTKLNEAMSRRFNDTAIPEANRTHKYFQFASVGEIRGVFDELIKSYEKKVDSWLSNIPVTAKERVALVSLAWNNAGKLLGDGLRKALQTGNRAEAWYQIRYYSNGDKLSGIAKRRFYESEVFGLYDSSDKADNKDEAIQVYQMYTAHRDKILQYEAKYGYLNGVAGTEGDQIALANSDYQLSDSSHPNEGDQVHTLHAELYSSAEALMNEYIKDEYGVDRNFNPLNIQVTSASQPRLYGENNDARTGSDKDLLIGRDVPGALGIDFLYGGAGDDTLIGLNGDDYLEGGIGNDILVGGKGNDTYVWNIGDGNDRIIEERDDDGKIHATIKVTYSSGHDFLAVGGFIREGTSNVWKMTTPDGSVITLTHNSPWKLVLNDGSSLEIGDFQSGDYGINLFEKTEYDRTLTGSDDDDDTASAVFQNLGRYCFTGTVTGTQPEYNLYPGWGEFIIQGDTPPNLKINGGGGNDELIGLAGSDYIQGGANNDKIYGEVNWIGFSPEDSALVNLWGTVGQTDILYGEDGNDVILASNGDDFVSGGNNNDILEGQDGEDTVAGDSGDDVVLGGRGNDTLLGGIDNDLLYGDGLSSLSNGWFKPSDIASFNFQMTFGEKGYVTTVNLNNFDVVEIPESGDDYLYGGAGNDMLYGGGGNDFLMGEGDNDTLRGGSGADDLWGGSGNDWLVGDEAGSAGGSDHLYGGEGSDDLNGAGGNDFLFGDGGSDGLSGGDGDDEMTGGTGDDKLVGGAGSDVYRFSLGDGNDVIKDSQGSNLISFGSGISPQNLFLFTAHFDENAGAVSFTGSGDSLWIEYGADDGILLANGSDATGFSYEFADGRVLSFAEVQAEANSNGPGQGTDPETPSDYVPPYPGHSSTPGGGYKISLGTSVMPMSYYDPLVQQAISQWLRYHNTPGSNFIDLTMADGYETTSVVFAGAVLGGNLFGSYPIGPDPSVSGSFTVSQRFVPIRDPLTFDLDNDGIETVSLNPENPILFDHTGDGIKQATGWVSADDGFLALDRDGNGTIDNGRELFGDSTPLYDAEGNENGLAEDGFAALRQEDSNADGVVNSQDARWGELRIWQDLNQDGTSQAGELKSLEQLGIVGINVAKSEHSLILPGGNEIADLGTFVRSDGSTGTAGTTSGLADVNLASDTFHRIFTDPIPLTPEAEVSPEMRGSGMVRDLREATSLSSELAGLLGEYAQAASRSEQLAQLDNLVLAWGKTSGGADMKTRVESNGYSFVTNLDASEQTRLTVLEQFNGRSFYRLPWEEENGVSGVTGMTLTTDAEGQTTLHVNMQSAQITLLNRAWQSLRQSVYDGLLLQTRLKPYIEGISFAEGAEGFDLDFSGMQDAFQVRFAATPAEAVRDLLDLQRLLGTELSGMGWDGYAQLRNWLRAAVDDGQPELIADLSAALRDFGYPGIFVQGIGGAAGETVLGAYGGDLLAGLGGNDLLLGSDLDDILSGGSGNDTLVGGAGNDTYLFNGGDGQDSIVENQGTTGSDTLQLGQDILVGDLDIVADGDKLVFRHTNGTDRLSISEWFGSLSNSAHRLDTLKFGDGGVIDLRTMRFGDYGVDILTGFATNDLVVGGAGDDQLNGEAGDDLLHGGAGIDIMAGGTGNDIYVVDSAGDSVIEAADEGVDTVQARVNYTLADNVENLILAGTASTTGTGNAMDNILIGNSGNNSLFGMDGDDSLSGGAGNDLLDGGTGADAMAGGRGDDTYVIDNLGDQVVEAAGEGNDTVRSSIDYTLNDNLENLTLTGVAAVYGTGNELGNVVTGNAADNTLVGLVGNDTLDGGIGADTMMGGNGDDTYVVDSSGDMVIEEVGEGTDSVRSSISYTLTDAVENLTLTGSAPLSGTGNELDNVITGNSGVNLLTGLVGNDTLDGGAGADILVGGIGNDMYVADNTNDIVIENDGEGIDTVRSSATFTLAANAENLVLTGGGNINGIGNELDNVLVGNYGNNILDGGLGADNMAGGMGSDTYILDNTGDRVSELANQGVDTVVSPFDYTLGDNLENLTLTGEALTGTGNGLDNVITGTANGNTLTGLDGNDTLDGGAGGDLLVGGRGNDVYVVDNLADVTVEGEAEGIDTVQAGLTWTLADNLENLILTGTQAIDGTGNELDNVITGNEAANTLIGLAGNDTLDGGAGADYMAGGLGDDTYVVENIGDEVVENIGEGTDTVKSAISYTLTDNVENLTLTGTSSTRGTGNELNNVMLGNSGANTLMGLAGDDLLDGGAGADTLIGGSGNDTYDVENGGDVVVEAAGEGVDLVLAGVSQILSDNVENLTLTGANGISGTGNDLANILIGNSGANVLDGRSGADIMAGNGGNDTYVVDNTGDLVQENANQGVDTVRASIDYTLTANVEHLELTGSANLAGTGNELVNAITGNNGDNVLSGLAGNDVLVGNGGNDLLDGGTGIDHMTGGTGDDIYVVDNTGDVVVELTEEGTDTVRSSINYVLGDNVENLELAGTLDIDGTGNELANILTGNSGANRLDGGAGADIMAGGEGDDFYLVDDAADLVVEETSAGIDTVETALSHTLAANVENLILTGEEDLSGTGNELDNSLTGNAGNNLLDGGAGVDTMAGGLGDDTYFVDNTADVISENPGEGTDVVFASTDYTLSDNIEQLTLVGDGDLAGAGNDLDNILTGNSGVNVLAGGAGNDTYIVDRTEDTVVEAAGQGTDTVLSSADYTLSENVENLMLTGTAAINGTGNDLANTILGNSGANRLDGGAGGDTMAGGAGDDIYIVDNSGDLVLENTGEGTDLVQSSVTYTLGANLEHLTLTGAGAIDGTGNSVANTILGNSADNRLYGLAGNDTLFGGEGNDYLDGGSGADAMSGGLGNDSYVVDNVGDQVSEFADEGTDTVYAGISYTLGDNVENLTLTGTAGISGTGNALDNIITGNTGSNGLYGLAGDDTLIGNNGNDTLDGGTGADAMSGGYGNDTYVVDNIGDVVSEAVGQGTDQVRSSIDYVLTDNVENLTLTGTANLTGTGNNLNNVITGNEGSNLLDGRGGNDTLYGNGSDDTLIGGDGNDALYGGAGADQLFGDGGADTLDGGAGADTMFGGSGNDTYIMDNAGDLITEYAGEGVDLVQSSVTTVLTDNVENLTLTGSAAINGTGNELGNVISGNSGANVLDGLEGNDTIYGNGGNDTLIGGIGNDYLDGGTGVDTMSGGSGDDTYIVDNTGDQIFELEGEGTDTVQSNASYTLSDNVENLTLTGSGYINGTGNGLANVIIGNSRDNTLNGLAGDDTLIGNNGNDTLNGGLGADKMSGASGNDTYVVDDIGDQVTEAAGQGTDLVYSGIDYTLGDNVENLTLTGTENLAGTGNSLNNVITGNEGNNLLSGLAGNDILYGNGGDDILIGGTENDQLYGGAGTDQLFGNDGADTLDGGAGIDTMSGGSGNDVYFADMTADVVVENAGEGIDLVQASADYTLSDNVENLTLTGTADIDGIGNELDNEIRGNAGANRLDGLAGNDTIYGQVGDDTLIGGAGNDYLDGGSGADTMSGGADNDSYVVDNAGDQVVEVEDEGLDTVYAGVSYTLSANVENLVLTGSAGLTGTGNELDNTLTGNAAVNTLYGLAGNDILVGNGGNDMLDGGTGSDTMSGGGGNDGYVVDDAGDVVNEAANEGVDEVFSSIDYILGDNIENLTLTGTADLAGTGNTLANTLKGNAGSNILDGGAGADTMIGGAGDDTYLVDASSDVVIEAEGGGTDTVYAGADYVLSDHLENLYLTGTAAISGTGNAGANLIFGNTGGNTLSGLGGNDILHGEDGSDYLDGGSGADQLFGEGGNDIYVVDDVDDQVFENAGEGIDTVRAGIDYTLGENLENLLLTGTNQIEGTGNALTNVLTGNEAGNVLSGLAGDDTLIGNGGDDTLIGGAGNDLLAGGSGNDTYYVDDAGDQIVEAANAGNDTVVASMGYVLGAQVENLVLTGLADLNGSGNDLNNMLTGNAGNNILDGGLGSDAMIGGAGNDLYIVDDLNDTVVEAAGEGIDTVWAGVDHTLAAEVENLVLTGTGAINGSGNDLANVITGNSAGNVLFGGGGDDQLDGGMGADTMAGGTGNDIYRVDNAADIIVESIDGGADTVLSEVTYALSDHVETLRLMGEGNIDGIGSDQDNTLLGNSGDNVLTGGGGNDYLHGAGGNDLLLGGEGNDRYVFLLGDGNDRIDDNLGDNSLYVGSGLGQFDLEADRVGDDMVVRVYGTADSFVLADWYTQNGGGLNSMMFDDGTILDRTGIDMLTNRPPVAGPDHISVHEDGGSQVFSTALLLANDTDPNPWDVLAVDCVGTSAVGVSVALVDGKVTYDIGKEFQYLAEGEVLADSFSYIVRDLKGTTDEGIVQVDIIGTNDIPIVEADAAQVVEDAVTAVEGNLLANDRDIDVRDVLSIAAPGTFAGVYGSLSMAADGNYVYTLDNENSLIQSLGRFEALTEYFNFNVTDGLVEVASTLGVSIYGTNDAPAVAAPLEDHMLTLNKPFSWTLPEGSFTDCDNGDVLDYTATLTDGSALPEWLSFDADTLTFSGWSPKHAEYFDVTVTARDRVAADGSTNGSLSVADVFCVTVGNGNEGVGNGEDAAPAGQEVNANDGPGTSPGNPGSQNRKNGSVVYVFDTPLQQGSAGVSINGFREGIDKIELHDDIFPVLTETGTLLSQHFYASPDGSAVADDHYFLYNTASGALLYDADGSGEGLAVDLAVLNNKPRLTAEDFAVAS